MQNVSNDLLSGRVSESRSYSGDDRKFPHYAIQVRHRYERIVHDSLCVRGFASFLPLYKVRRKWSDRMMEIDELLFPGYVFCSMDLRNRLPVLTAPGVLSIVGAGKQPVPVDAQELEAVRAMVSLGRDVQPCPAVPGQKVRIETGPLKGLEGALLEVRGKNRLVISISILNRSISAIVERSETAPLNGNRGFSWPAQTVRVS